VLHIEILEIRRFTAIIACSSVILIVLLSLTQSASSGINLYRLHPVIHELSPKKLKIKKQATGTHIDVLYSKSKMNMTLTKLHSFLRYITS
jgi:hypothetical protein